MNITRTTLAMTNGSRFWRDAAVLLCVVLLYLALPTAHATNTTNTPTAISNTQEPISLFTARGLNQRLEWLRDATIDSFATGKVSLSIVESNRFNMSDAQFDSERQLFKPIDKTAYINTLKRMLKQQLGFQVRDNFRFECELKRYRTPSAQREVGVKLGVHYDFY